MRSKTASKAAKSVAASALTQVRDKAVRSSNQQLSMHETTFAYLKPTTEQLEVMEQLRQASAAYATVVDQLVPDGADKTYILRRIRGTAMWINVAVTRHSNGEPRT